jgi:cytochrome c553
MKTTLAGTLVALALVVLALVVLPHTGAAQAQHSAPKGDPARAQGQISMCNGCHGIVGYRTAYPKVYHVPRIGGQNPGYIVKALEAYKSGERDHPSMRGIAASLTPQDMANLAAYYSERPK